MLGRRALMAGSGVVAALAFAPPAAGQATVGACEARALAQAECGRLSVPLDHGDRSPAGARIGLAFVRFPAREARRGTVVFLAGGPGEAATPGAADLARGPLRDLRARYDLIVVDQRGTGRSSPLTCSAAPKGVLRLRRSAGPAEAAATVRRCSEEIGEARRFYSTYETALDLEDLRAALEVERIIPLGVSYGGQVAGEYARRFPDRVAAVVLDSTSPIEGIDALDRLPRLALPRVLREICFPPGCDGIFGDPSRLLSAAVARLSRGPLRGRVVLPSGRTRTAALRVGDLYELVRASDQDPALRTALPAALQAAARGDAAPLLRLALGGGSGGGAESAINDLRFLATTCTEGRLPWSPESDPSSRPALLEQALRAEPDAYAPFPVEAVAPEVTAGLCLGWAPTSRPPFPPAPNQGPEVPVLVLAGRDDLRTPLEDQRRAAAQFPRARLQPVPNVGHSVLGSDPTGCARASLRRFLAGASFGRCVRTAREVPLALPVFRDLAELPGAAGRQPRRAERTAVAVDVTLRDVARQVAAVAAGASGDVSGSALRVGGLRGGRLEVRRSSLVLRSYEVVRGVRLTGRLDGRFRGTLAVTGTAARGTVTVRRSGAFRADLDGAAFAYRPRPLGADRSAVG